MFEIEHIDMSTFGRNSDKEMIGITGFLRSLSPGDSFVVDKQKRGRIHTAARRANVKIKTAKETRDHIRVAVVGHAFGEEVTEGYRYEIGETPEPRDEDHRSGEYPEPRD